jgi:hypothetical protein
MTNPQKTIIGIVVFIISFLLGIWIGEDVLSHSFLSWTEFVSGLLMALAIWAIRIKRLLRRVVIIGIVFLVFVSGDWIGRWSFTHAYNECVKYKEFIRSDLRNFKSTYGYYPKTLEELNCLDSAMIPGQRILRPNIMKYEKKGDGYRLEFKDAMVTHEATNERGFLATK